MRRCAAISRWRDGILKEDGLGRDARAQDMTWDVI